LTQKREIKNHFNGCIPEVRSGEAAAWPRMKRSRQLTRTVAGTGAPEQYRRRSAPAVISTSTCQQHGITCKHRCPSVAGRVVAKASDEDHGAGPCHIPSPVPGHVTLPGRDPVRSGVLFTKKLLTSAVSVRFPSSATMLRQ